MNSQPDNESLGRLLRDNWQVQPTKNPAFRAAVWQRIETGRRTPATWGAWLRRNALRFASVAVASVIIAGTGGGWIAASQTNHDREELVQRYLASIDPHQQAGTNSR